MKCRISVFQRAFHFSCRKNQIPKNSTNSGFTELHVEVRTCGQLYEKWRKEKRYWKVPDGNLYFKIAYIDTAVDCFRENRDGKNNSKPVAVALHGAPGLYGDFASLTSHLHANGVRVVIPKLPDFSVYKPGIFRQSAEEKAELIKDFLKEINLTKIDMLICHSGSVYPALRLCVEKDLPEIRSLAMLNPGAFSIVRAITPYKILRFIVQLSEFPVGLKFLEFVGTYLLKIVRVRVRLDNFMDPLLSATTMCHSDFPKAKGHFEIIKSQKTPIFFAFGEDDKLIDGPKSYDTAYLLGATDEDVFHYDQNGKLDHLGVETPFLKVMAFKEGSHYVFWKHPEIINEAITSFLFKVINEHR